MDETNLYVLEVGWSSIDDHLERFPKSEQGAALAALLGPLFAEEPFVVHFADTDLSG